MIKEKALYNLFPLINEYIYNCTNKFSYYYLHFNDIYILNYVNYIFKITLYIILFRHIIWIKLKYLLYRIKIIVLDFNF